MSVATFHRAPLARFGIVTAWIFGGGGGGRRGEAERVRSHHSSVVVGVIGFYVVLVVIVLVGIVRKETGCVDIAVFEMMWFVRMRMASRRSSSGGGSVGRANRCY